MKQRRITFIIDGLGIGGAERIVYELATRLDPERFIPEVISLFRDAPEAQPIFQELQQAGVQTLSIPKRSKVGLSVLEDLSQHLQKNHPHIVHTHLFAADVWGTLAARRAHISAIVSTEHNINKSEGWLKHQLKCWTSRHRHATVAISQAVEQYIQSTCSSCSDSVAVIPNGIVIDRFFNIKDTAEHDTSVPSLAVVGRIEEQKGHADLLRALPLVQSEYSLRIVGDGSLRPHCEQLVKELQLSDRVTFEPARSDIENVYREVDIICIPSRWEGLGLVALEAQASGCAVIASAVDGLQEIISHEKNGLLVDCTEPQSAATQLDRLISDHSLRQSLVQQAREDVQQYSIVRMVEQYQALYESLV